MQFEVIRKSHKKEIIIGVIVFVTIAIVLIVHQSFAKYQTVKNMKIAEGTINYKVPDFKIMAMYKQKEESTCTEDNCYEEITDRMPTSGYIINESKSYCTLDNVNKDAEAKLFTNENGGHEFKNLAKNEKCNVYFDKILTAVETILGNITVKSETPNFTASTTDEGAYKATDESGKDSYYFRGAVTNNYVKFANKYWRIIRINGDESIRLIYDGTSIHENGASTSDSIVANKSFNVITNNNIYVGFKYTSGQVHGTGTKSTILETLETWYSNNLTSYASKLNMNAGFCGDRTPYTNTYGTTSGGGTGTTKTYYEGYIRLLNNTKSPSLTCPTVDFYTVSGSSKGNKSLTYPIGLISIDEVMMAGGVYGTTNQSYYLYNGQYYWTLSPSYYDGGANVFVVTSYGFLNWGSAGIAYGIRPVINLRSDVILIGKGTVSNPYVVQ